MHVQSLEASQAQQIDFGCFCGSGIPPNCKINLLGPNKLILTVFVVQEPPKLPNLCVGAQQIDVGWFKVNIAFLGRTQSPQALQQPPETKNAAT